MKDIIEKATKISSGNKNAVKKSKKCGCYYCCNIFDAKDVTIFVDVAKSAQCPLCGVDAVIPDKSVPNLTGELLVKMKERWFKDIDLDFDIDEKLQDLCLECVKDIKSIIKKHDFKGKIRTILAICAMKILVSNYANPYVTMENCKDFDEEKPLIQLLPNFFDDETWREITDYVIEERTGKFKEYDIGRVLDNAAFMVDRPKNEEKQKAIDEIYDAYCTNR